MKPRLSHTTKVKLRQALTALRSNDAKRSAAETHGGYRPVTVTQHEDAEKRIVHKAGFQSRQQLEDYARKHQLLGPFIDFQAHLELEPLP